MPLPLLPILGVLAQFAPQISKWLDAGKTVQEVVETASTIAKQVTGTQDTNSAVEILKSNPELAMAYEARIMDQDMEYERLYIADKAAARKRDEEFLRAGKRNYRADSMYVLAVLVIAALVWAVLASDIDEYGKGIITLVLGRFLGYLDNIYNFEYGTNRSSKQKDDTISDMAKDR